MEKIKTGIYGVLGVLLFSFLAKGCFSDYKKGGDKNTIQNCEKIIADNSFVVGEFNESYTEQTIKIMRIPTKTYIFSYKYEVEGKVYNGSHTFTTLPESDTTKVYYLKTNPNVKFLDPIDVLNKEKEKNSSNSALYWGIGWSVLALGALLSLIGLFKKERVATGTD
jgi:hypothetical protein